MCRRRSPVIEQAPTAALLTGACVALWPAWFASLTPADARPGKE